MTQVNLEWIKWEKIVEMFFTNLREKGRVGKNDLKNELKSQLKEYAGDEITEDDVKHIAQSTYENLLEINQKESENEE